MIRPGLAAASVAAALLAAAAACSSPPSDRRSAPAPGSVASDQPAVILMIGDGMGPAQIEAASRYATGKPDGLFLSGLPRHGRLLTGSLSGIADSAAAGTAMACGVPAYDEGLGLDARGREAENLVELAHARGWAAGLVTTSRLTDATPASFVVHAPSRRDEAGIAEAMAGHEAPEVMLGGGARFFLPAGASSARGDGGLLAGFEERGYAVARSREELESARPLAGRKLLGLFAGAAMEAGEGRPPAEDDPSLSEMALAALEALGARAAPGPESPGFFLLIEEEGIDESAHRNDLPGTIESVLGFDDAVRAVAGWAARRPNVTLLVTGDHETGGLEVTRPAPAGSPSEATWSGRGHTNALVPIFGSGPLSETFQGKILPNRWIHSVAAARITSGEVAAPAAAIVPDGDLRDLRAGALQEIEEMPGEIRLDSLRVGADAIGLGIGVEGLFERHNSALVILVDADFGAGTGLADLQGAPGDPDGTADRLLSSLGLDASSIGGFGADFALVEVGGAVARTEAGGDRAGLRALRPPGPPGRLGAAIVYGPYRPAPEEGETYPPPEGLEAFIPWDRLYPALGGGVPPGATLAMAAFHTSVDGSVVYNQALPHFPAGVAPAQRGKVQVPGVVVLEVDPDRDGVAGGAAAPRIEWSGGPATSPRK